MQVAIANKNYMWGGKPISMQVAIASENYMVRKKPDQAIIMTMKKFYQYASGHC